jgi:hypothetical protein
MKIHYLLFFIIGVLVGVIASTAWIGATTRVVQITDSHGAQTTFNLEDMRFPGNNTVALTVGTLGCMEEKL